MKLHFVIVALLTLALPAAASADSIVYAKQGNLFLTSPDGARAYQLTTDGGYSSPSQADDGTIGAIRNHQLVRLDRAGRTLSSIPAVSGGPIGGPYEARLSPDGTRFAYYFYVQSSFDDSVNHVRWIDTGSYGTWTPADHFELPEYDRSLTQPEWLTNDRLLGTQGMYLNMWTWKLGTGSGYTYPAAQWWFGLRDPVDQWGVAAYHWYDDPSLSRDGTKLAMTDQGQQLVLAATHGPAYSGEPPYPEPDYVNPASDLAAPTIACRGPVTKTVNPTFSSDGGTVAYGAPDGVHLINADCTGDRLLAPGGSEPAFGPADVTLPQLAPPPPPPVLTPATKLTLTQVSARRAHGRVTVRFTLSAPARVTLLKTTISAHAGVNTIRVKSRKRTLILRVQGLPPKRIQLR